MKKAVLVEFCIMILCSSFLVGIATAGEPGYTLMEAYQTNAVTLDGKWTSGTEWSDAYILPMVGTTLGANGIWAYKMVMGDTYLMSFLIESPDNTNDASDLWTICIDGANDGGSAPNSNDVKIEIAGHTTLRVFAGNGTGWSTRASTGITMKDSLATSTYNSGNHYVLEAQVDKGAMGDWGANPPPHGVFVSMYDASNASRGTVAWPPTSANSPGRWGVIATYDTAVPEGFTIAFVAVLSTIAMIGALALRRSKTSTYFFRSR